jgi:hypothetical protein
MDSSFASFLTIKDQSAAKESVKDYNEEWCVIKAINGSDVSWALYQLTPETLEVYV